MELRAGYKQTDIGIIPEDWEVKCLGEIATCYSGGTPNTSVREYYNGNINWISSSELNKGRILQTDEFISELGLNNSSAKEVPSETFLLAMYGATAGVSAITYVKGAINQAVLAIVPKETNSEFLFQYFRLNKEKIIKTYTQGGQPNLSGSIVKSISIPLPPTKTEQAAIATALSDADALISSLEKLITKKRNIKQGAMQKLLQPKEGWEVKKLGDFLDYEQPTEYLVSDTEYNDNNQTPVLTAGKTFILGYTSEEHGIFTNLPVIIFDDFTTAIKYVDFPFKAKSSAMKMLFPKNNSVNLRFVYEIMLQVKYKVADHKRHWIGEYSKIEIAVPPSPKEQNAIATILSDMDNEIAALENKLAKYRNIKIGMMQNLLTGKIRL